MLINKKDKNNKISPALENLQNAYPGSGEVK